MKTSNGIIGTRLRQIVGGVMTSGMFAFLAVLFNKHYEISDPLTTLRVGINLQWLAGICLWFAAVSFGYLVIVLVAVAAEVGWLKDRNGRLQSNPVLRWVISEANDSPRTPSFRLVAGVAVVCTIVLLGLVSRWDVLEDDQINGKLYEVASVMRGQIVRTGAYTNIVRGVLRSDASNENVLSADLRDLVEKLNRANAAAILVPDLEGIRGTIPLETLMPQSRQVSGPGRMVSVSRWTGSRERPELVMYRRSMSTAGNVVIYSSRGSVRAVTDSLGPITLPHGQFAAWPSWLWPGGSLVRVPVRPAGTQMNAWDGYDVLLPLLRFYRQLSISSAVEMTASWAKLGSDILPLSGPWLYARDVYATQMPQDLFAMRGSPFPFTSMTKHGELSIHRADAGPPTPGNELPGRLEVEQLRELVQGKIVLVWVTPGMGLEESAVRAYASALQAILNDQVISKPALGWLVVSLLTLLGAVLIAWLLRPLAAVLWILFLGIGLFAGLSYLYDHHRILIDLAYPMLAVGISSWVLPLAKFAARRK